MGTLQQSHRDDWRLAEHLYVGPAQAEAIFRNTATHHTPDEIRQHLIDERKHQGYANYETFSIALVLHNDRHLQATAREIVASAGRPVAAELLKRWVEQAIGELAGGDWRRASWPAGLRSDVAEDFASLADTFISASLSEVDWLEVADEFAPTEVAS